MTYDQDGHLTSITDPVGRSVIYNYSGGRLSSINDPAGRTTNFTYIGGYLRSVVFPDGTQKVFGYNDKGLLVAETNARNHTTQYAYSPLSRLESVIRPDGTTTTINDSASVTAANNYTGGNVGELKNHGIGEGQIYDGIKDARQVTTAYVKSEDGFITTVVDGDGQITKVERDGRGQPTKITRPDQTNVTFTYDPNSDDLLSQTDSALGITTSQTYDSFGNVLSIKNGRGFTSAKTYYSTTGLLASSRDPLGHGTVYLYNSLGLPTSIDAFGKVTTYTYDTSGNVATIKDPLNHVTSYTRDLAGNITSMTNAKNQTTVYAFDSFNRLVSVTSPLQETTTYTYLSTGELETIKDPLGNIISFEYDELGRVKKKTDALGYVIDRVYDGNGNVIRETDPNGNVKGFAYDNLNQLITKTLPDNNIQLSYDVRGRIKSATNHEVSLEFGYDVGGRMTSAQTAGAGTSSNLPNITLIFGYDANGNRTSLTDPTGITTYTYDNADRLNSVTNPLNENYAFGFDDVNRLTSISRPGTATTLSFDDANFVTSIIHSSKTGNGQIEQIGYQIDPIGNRTSVTTGAGSSALGYDNKNQLTSATNPEVLPLVNSGQVPNGMQSETFGYDAIANRTQDQGGGYIYDNKSQRLNEDYRYTYAYDNNGNLISKTAKGFTGEVTNYYYSSENQLTSFKVYLSGSSSPVKEVSYIYDALGRRIQKKVVDHTAESDPVKTFTRRYLYDGQELLIEYDENNAVLARYTHSTLKADDVLSVYVTSNGVAAKLAQTQGTYEYLKDAQGTIRDIASLGARVQHYVYAVFGATLGILNAQGAEISTNPVLRTHFSYTGREYDNESGNYYYRARYYNPLVGRFLQKDPAPGELSTPSTVINSYTYALNNPANRLDPTGRFSIGSITRSIGQIADAFGGKSILLGFVAALAMPAISTLAFVNFSGVVSESALVQINTIAAVAGISVLSAGAGSIAGGAVGGVWGVGAGTAAGALAGAGVGAAAYAISGVGPVWQGALFGAIAGAFAGYYSATTSSHMASNYGPEGDTTRELCGPVGPQGIIFALGNILSEILFFIPPADASGMKFGNWGCTTDRVMVADVDKSNHSLPNRTSVPQWPWNQSETVLISHIRGEAFNGHYRLAKLKKLTVCKI